MLRFARFLDGFDVIFEVHAIMILEVVDVSLGACVGVDLLSRSQYVCIGYIAGIFLRLPAELDVLAVLFELFWILLRAN